MAWRRPGDKPWSEPMMISLVKMHICVTRPQWVNILGTRHISRQFVCDIFEFSWVKAITFWFHLILSLSIQSKYTSVDSGNGLATNRQRANILTNPGLLTHICAIRLQWVNPAQSVGLPIVEPTTFMLTKQCLTPEVELRMECFDVFFYNKLVFIILQSNITMYAVAPPNGWYRASSASTMLARLTTCELNQFHLSKYYEFTEMW